MSVGDITAFALTSYFITVYLKGIAALRDVN